MVDVDHITIVIEQQLVTENVSKRFNRKKSFAGLKDTFGAAIKPPAFMIAAD